MSIIAITFFLLCLFSETARAEEADYYLHYKPSNAWLLYIFEKSKMPVGIKSNAAKKERKESAKEVSIFKYEPVQGGQRGLLRGSYLLLDSQGCDYSKDTVKRPFYPSGIPAEWKKISESAYEMPKDTMLSLLPPPILLPEKSITIGTSWSISVRFHDAWFTDAELEIPLTYRFTSVEENGNDLIASIEFSWGSTVNNVKTTSPHKAYDVKRSVTFSGQGKGRFSRTGGYVLDQFAQSKIIIEDILYPKDTSREPHRQNTTYSDKASVVSCRLSDSTPFFCTAPANIP